MRAQGLAAGVIALVLLSAAWWVWHSSSPSMRTAPAIEREAAVAEAEQTAAELRAAEPTSVEARPPVIRTDVAPSLPESQPELPSERDAGPEPILVGSLPFYPEEPEAPGFAIEGALLRESGDWNSESLPDRDELVIELVSLDDPEYQRRGRLIIATDLEGVVTVSYAFRNIPEGDYELSIFNLGALRWSPSSVRVIPPAYGLDFICHDLDDQRPLRFEVYDAQTGETIEEFSSAHLEQTVSADNGVFMHAGPLAADSFPSDLRFHWSVWAAGYRPAFGDERDFIDVEGERVARVELARGWAARIVVLGRDPSMKPLMNAEVVIDGVSFGKTDEQGALVVALDEVPESVDVRFRDWKLENDPFDARPGTSDAVRGFVLPLIVAPPE